jgi:hypothetical protein
VFINKTKAEQKTDTIEFLPQQVLMPYKTPTDVAIQASNQLIRVLQNHTPSTPFAHIGHDQLTAIQPIADIFQNHTTTKTHTSPRVVKANNNTRRTLPRVPNMQVPIKHRYPTQQAKSLTQHKINTVEELILPTPTPTIHHWANSIIDPDTGASMEYRHLIKSPKHEKDWKRSFANELGRLAQGIGGQEKGTNTVYFISHDKFPQDRRKDVTYGRICVDYWPQKAEPNRTRLTVGGNLIDYPGDVSTPTAGTTTAKLVINTSTIPTPNARYMCGIPDEIFEAYQLEPMLYKDHIYMEIRQGMYGLPQAGILANHLLTKRLEPHIYGQCRHTPGLWKHKWKPILFSLVMDEFGIN